MPAAWDSLSMSVAGAHCVPNVCGKNNCNVYPERTHWQHHSETATESLSGREKPGCFELIRELSIQRSLSQIRFYFFSLIAPDLLEYVLWWQIVVQSWNLIVTPMPFLL